MTTQEQIDALPEWPVVPPINLTNTAVEIKWLDQSLTAALARLALARDGIQELLAFVKVTHGRGPDCVVPEFVITPLGINVRIGDIVREADALLNALEVPRD